MSSKVISQQKYICFAAFFKENVFFMEDSHYCLTKNNLHNPRKSEVKIWKYPQTQALDM